MRTEGVVAETAVGRRVRVVEDRKDKRPAMQEQRWGGAPAFVLVGLAALCVLLAAGLALVDAAGARAQVSGPFGIAQDVHTSFGVIAAESVTFRTGPDTLSRTAGLDVRSDQEQVQVLVAITNELATPVAYSADPFTIAVDGRDAPVSVSASGIEHGTLLPRASIEGRLFFVVPAHSGRITLQFKDPGYPQPFLIALN